jgi:hypothetical protein
MGWEGTDEPNPYQLHGFVLNVKKRVEQDYLSADVGFGDTVIAVDDASIFDEGGGRIAIVDPEDKAKYQYDYDSSDPDADTVTLSGAGLEEGHDAGSAMMIMPQHRMRIATVQTDYDDGDVVEARIPHSLKAFLPIGSREDVIGEDDTRRRRPEEVIVELIHDDWMITEVLGGQARHNMEDDPHTSDMGRAEYIFWCEQLVADGTDTPVFDVDEQYDPGDVYATRVTVGTAPTADLTLTLRKNGSTFSTLVIKADTTEASEEFTLGTETYVEDDTFQGIQPANMQSAGQPVNWYIYVRLEDDE